MVKHMLEQKQDDKNEAQSFLYEKIKERPVNKKRLLRRTIITAGLAVIFGLIACFTFILLEPFFSNWIYPENEPEVIVFPEDEEEISPEDMLTENMIIEGMVDNNQDNAVIDKNELQTAVDNIILDKDDYKQMYQSMKAYSDQLATSIVSITGTKSNVDWMDNIEKSEQKSFGLIVANNGKDILILTYYNDIKDAESLIVTFSNNVGVEGIIQESDTQTGFAIVSVDLSLLDESMIGKSATVAVLGSSKDSVIIGTPVIALGNPSGINNSMDYGMVTGTGRIDSNIDTNYKLLQTNIFGSKKSSGFLFNLYGQLVGVIINDKSLSDNSSVVSAIGVTELKKTIEKMSNGESLAYMGIQGVDVPYIANKESQVPYGAYVTEVIFDSPAMMAGIQQGDIIVGINDKDIVSYSTYSSEIMKMESGQQIEVKVMRQYQNMYKEMIFKIELD